MRLVASEDAMQRCLIRTVAHELLPHTDQSNYWLGTLKHMPHVIRFMKHTTHVIRFMTAKFDVSKERPNPIIPIPGESLLLWLRERARPDMAMSEPYAEDWGWYSYVEWNGRRYMLSSSASEDYNGDREWILQIEKLRSVTEKLLGRAKMSKDDECAKYFQCLLECEATFKGVSVDPEP